MVKLKTHTIKELDSYLNIVNKMIDICIINGRTTDSAIAYSAQEKLTKLNKYKSNIIKEIESLLENEFNH